MTQEVQPLTWQKRTNIEEHMQFFSKINEIIANLAPTVDEAEQAIADANAAIATANAASAAADAAAQSAQASAATVAGYNTRLSQVEQKAIVNASNISSLSYTVSDVEDMAIQLDADLTRVEGRMTAAESKNTQQDDAIAGVSGRVSALENVQGNYLKKAGAAQTVTSEIMVPTTATGVRDTQIANGTRIQNDLDAYEPMVRTTGSKTIYGQTIIPFLISNPHTNLNSIDYIIGKFQYAYTTRVHTFTGYYCDRFAAGVFYIRIGTDGAVTAQFKGIATPSTNVVVYIDNSNILYIGLNSESTNTNAEFNFQVNYAAGNSIPIDPVFKDANEIEGITLMSSTAWTVV